MICKVKKNAEMGIKIMDTEMILEFDKIKEMWTELALTKWAKEKIRNTIPYMSESELLTKQRETTEAKQLIEKSGNPPLVSLNKIREYIQIAKTGNCLSVLQLE